MRTSLKYLLFVAVFVVAVGFIVISNNRKPNPSSRQYPLLERRGSSMQLPDWSQTRTRAKSLMTAVLNDREDKKSRLELAAMYIQEARITGDFNYYDAAAMKYVNDVLQSDSENFEALIYKAVIQLSQHHFAEGLTTATTAQNTNPHNAFVYGILVDANVELGNYEEAVKHADKMVSIRPDLRSYSRIAYLREIHGDIPGAIEAMKMAIEAGMPGDEGTEWCRVQLAKLYEQQGNLKVAEGLYQVSLEERPGYAYALAGLGRLASASGRYDEAVSNFQQAYKTVKDPGFREEMILALKAKGDLEKAKEAGNSLIGEMTAEAPNVEDSAGHYSDRELAYAWLLVNSSAKALEHAIIEYNRRPLNNDVNETVAWVHYSNGDHMKAMPFIKTALRTNSKNPTLLTRAGLIYVAAGQTTEGIELLKQALSQNPVIEVELKTKGHEVLKQNTSTGKAGRGSSTLPV